MADPYAARAETDVGTAPTGPPPWTETVEKRQGLAVSTVEELTAAKLGAARFVCLVCRGAGLLPPLARLSPAAAVALLLTHDEVTADAKSAREAHGALDAVECALYAIKHGWVAGPEDRPGAVPISAELVASVLDTEGRGEVVWEIDPDFGYELPTQVPEVEGAAALALSPRLLYTAFGRAYEHAALVAATKSQRQAKLEAIDGLDPAIVCALG